MFSSARVADGDKQGTYTIKFTNGNGMFLSAPTVFVLLCLCQLWLQTNGLDRLIYYNNIRVWAMQLYLKWHWHRVCACKKPEKDMVGMKWDGDGVGIIVYGNYRSKITTLTLQCLWTLSKIQTIEIDVMALIGGQLRLHIAIIFGFFPCVQRRRGCSQEQRIEARAPYIHAHSFAN